MEMARKRDLVAPEREIVLETLTTTYIVPMVEDEKKIKVGWTQNIETKIQIVSRYFIQCFTKTDKTFSYEICFSPSSTETIQKIHIRLKTKVGRPSYLKESFAPDCAPIYKYDQAITHDWSWQSYMIIATVAIHWAMRLGIAHGFGMLNCVFL